MKTLAVAAAAILGVTFLGDPPRRHPPGHARAGLPIPGAQWTPFHAAPDHVLNRVFRALYIAEAQPVHVGAALPGEHGDDGFWRERWMLEWRDGTEADRGLFGGDGRQLPREGFSQEEAAALARDLDALDDGARAELVAIPELAVLFQHDLLKACRRLMDTGRNADLLPALWRAAQWAALTDDEAGRLRDLLPEALRSELATATVGMEERGVGVPTLESCANAGSGFCEVLRRSTRLFDGGRTLLWSRLFLAHPDGADATAALIGAAADGEAPTVIVGTRAVLYQGVVALLQSGRTVATPVLIDVRTQVLAHRNGVSADDPTTSRDGVDFGMLQLERQGLRQHGPAGAYRVVGDDDQDLFRDYGTLKHTTYRAQCALCHRTTGTPEPELGGYPVLRKQAQPEVAVSGTERTELAVQQVTTFVEGLRKAFPDR